MREIEVPYVDRVELAIAWIREKAPRTVSGGGEGERALLRICHVLRSGFALSDDTTFSLLKDYLNPDQAPGDRWSDTELRHKIKESSKQVSQIAYGAHLRKASGIRGDRQIAEWTYGANNGEIERAKWTDPVDLGDPIETSSIDFLKKLFKPGEHVHIRYKTATEGDSEKRFNSGITKPLEDWISLAKQGGGVAQALTTDPSAEFYVCPNPMLPNGRKDEDIASHRFTVLEFDNLPLEEQNGLLRSCNVPGTFVINTAGRSLHCLVPVMANDRAEFDLRRKFLDEYLAVYKPDQHCKNPSRMTRLPDTLRDGKRIVLQDMGIGALNWKEWFDERSIELCGQLMTVDSLLEFDTANNPDDLIGNRWLERGTAAMLFGPTGIGKSVLTMMMAGFWALGLAFFGVRPKRPLRVVIMQAENTEADMAESFRAMLKGLRKHQKIEEGSPEDEEMLATLRENFRMIRNDRDTGEKWVERARQVIVKFDADILFSDPLLAYSGCDASDQEKMTKLLRNQINPMLAATRCSLFFVHHIGKPRADQKNDKQRTIYQMAYAGLGSSEIMNWPRAIMVLEPISNEVFRLVFAKRGMRAGVTDATGTRTNMIFLRHSKDPTSPWWERVEESQVPTNKKKKRGLNSPETWADIWPQFVEEHWQTYEALSKRDLCARIKPFWEKVTGIDLTDADGTYRTGSWNNCMSALQEGGFIKQQNSKKGSKMITVYHRGDVAGPQKEMKIEGKDDDDFEDPDSAPEDVPF